LTHLDAIKMRPGFAGFGPTPSDGTIAAGIAADKMISAPPIPRLGTAR
jgi:hypothetical protein